MKKTLTRLLCVALLAVMVLSVFTACDKDKGPAGVVDIPGQTVENPNIPAKDYGGHEFTILTKEGNAYNTRYIVAEADTGEVLGDAITKRNSALEQKYNITIKQMKTESSIVDVVRTSVMSGTIEFDAIFANSNSLATMAIEGLLYDLNTVERFDFTKSYWDSNACEQLSMGGKLYFTNNATNIHALGWAMFFNKYLIE